MGIGQPRQHTGVRHVQLLHRGLPKRPHSRPYSGRRANGVDPATDQQQRVGLRLPRVHGHHAATVDR